MALDQLRLGGRVAACLDFEPTFVAGTLRPLDLQQRPARLVDHSSQVCCLPVDEELRLLLGRA